MEDPRLVYSQLLGRAPGRHRQPGAAAPDAGLRQAGSRGFRSPARMDGAQPHRFHWFWVLLPAVIVLALSVLHEHVLHFAERLRRAVRYFEQGAGAAGRQMGRNRRDRRPLSWTRRIPMRRIWTCSAMVRYSSSLCTARTHIGEDTLARWLLAPADPDTLRERHESVTELRPRLDLREDLAVVAEEARAGVDPASLAAWGEAPALIRGRGLRVTALALTALGVPAACAFVAYVGYQFGLVQMPETTMVRSRAFFLIVTFVNSAVLYRWRKLVQASVAASGRVGA